ncbi:MAG: tRNA guanosine(34) transglycosylase Tgt [Bacteroidales bacterium]|nr:tRNA guanosine(34) transglycosylase Tgt [Bacteroidales bacterium]
MSFSLLHTAADSQARVGLLHTDHGDIPTPIFMPVGTAGSVKAVHQHELRNEIDAKIILGNTYHLYLRPGLDILRQAGGLHRFNGWNRPLLTDSGGFQVFSLADNRKIREEGCTFRSHIDGSKHLFTPEKVMDIERIIGADIMMAFDECCPGDADHRYALQSMQLTHRWLDRCLVRFSQTEPLYGHHQALFPIVQGCQYEDLRRQSAEYIASKNPEGCAIGGLAVGEPTDVMYRMIEVVTAVLPTDRPRYLMGVGTPQNILEAIERGVDMFDCVMPTRNGRNGLLFTPHGTLNIKNHKWASCFHPIADIVWADVETEQNEDVSQPHSIASQTDAPFHIPASDSQYSLSYLHHLIRAQEILGLQICSIHNLAFYLWLVRTARRHILAGTFSQWKSGLLPALSRRL